MVFCGVIGAAPSAASSQLIAKIHGDMLGLLSFGTRGMGIHFHHSSCRLGAFLVRSEWVQWPLLCEKVCGCKCGIVVGFFCSLGTTWSVFCFNSSKTGWFVSLFVFTVRRLVGEILISFDQGY